MRMRARRSGDLNWLFLPGGPGIGSESLDDLVDAIRVPGTSWMVDLPGDGSNRDAPGAPEDPFSVWPDVLIEAARNVKNPVFVGHSTGGMYLLSVPGLAEALAGLALVSSAPSAAWMPAFARMTREHPLPAVESATAHYEQNPTDENLAGIAIRSAPWNFAYGHVEQGAALLARMPYNGAAVAWSDTHFDTTYAHRWWPTRVPTLILSGEADRIVTQDLWNDPAFTGTNVLHRTIPGGAHFPWLERPAAVRDAFAELKQRIVGLDP